MFKPKTTIAGRLENSSGEWIRTTDLRVMSNAPESVLFVRRVLQISQTGERWFLLARHAAIVDRCAYSSPFPWVRQARCTSPLLQFLVLVLSILSIHKDFLFLMYFPITEHQLVNKLCQFIDQP
jgi:hypothetical protein